MNILFDVTIFFFLLAIGIFLIETKANWKNVKRPRLMKTVAGVLGMSWAVVFYGSFIEPQLILVHEQTVQLGYSGVELNAVVVSDIHVGPYKGVRWVERLVERINAQSPDIIFIAGDFIVDLQKEVKLLDALEGLHAREGIYAVTGNHDYGDDAVVSVVEALESMGIIVLQNENVLKYFEGEEYILAGISDIWFAGDMYETTKFIPEDTTAILLSHNPDAVLLPNADRINLFIAGHTHGGQIRLPGIGSIPRIPTMLGNVYDRGLFTFGDQQLFITSGISETGPRARLFVPPEIVNLTIQL